jgi:hypothetical protein
MIITINACWIAILFALISNPSLAQSTDETIKLPKVWTGTQTATTFGTPAKLHPRHPFWVGSKKASKGFDYFTDSGFKLLIKRQQGRHLEIEFNNSRFSLPAVGTLSVDGKFMLVKSRFFTIPFTISGERISGCGGANGNDGTFDHWLNNYSALCFEAQAQP